MVFFFRIGFVILHPDLGSLENFHGLPPFGFGFDIGEPARVNIRYTFYICNNFNSFDSWFSGKKSQTDEYHYKCNDTQNRIIICCAYKLK